MTDKDLSTEADVETAEKKEAEPPRHLRESRVRVCGKWQKKGYKPTIEELKLWNERCKVSGRDPKTGKRKAAEGITTNREALDMLEAADLG